MKDQISIERIKKLHPSQREKFTNFIDELENEFSITIRVIQGFRTFKEQDDIYTQGRTKKGPVVTAARGGQSYHCFGFAVDIVPIVNGIADWNYDFGKFETISKKYGLTWGAHWHDNDHYENDLGRGPHGWTYLLELYKAGKVDKDGYILI